MLDMIEFYFYCIVTNFLSKTKRGIQNMPQEFHLSLEKQSQMHNNDFNMKYDITIMLFCLDIFAFEVCIFYLWCESVI